MRPIPLIDELREIRRQLAEEQMHNVERYATMLRKVADATPGTYIDKPLVPAGLRPDHVPAKSAG